MTRLDRIRSKLGTDHIGHFERRDRGHVGRGWGKWSCRQEAWTKEEEEECGGDNRGREGVMVREGVSEEDAEERARWRQMISYSAPWRKRPKGGK